MSELVLITGTSSGIGLAAAVACAAQGHRVVATLRSLERRKELEAAAAERGVHVDIEQLDVTAPDVRQKVGELVLKYGPFYALVNNASTTLAGVFEEQDEAESRELFETNVFGLMAVTRAVLPTLRAQGRGRIINVSSVSGRVALPGLATYAATKFAIEGLTEALRFELEPFGIAVCLVEPGAFGAPALDRAPPSGRPIAEYGPVHDEIARLYRESAEGPPPPEPVAQAIAALVTAPSPPLRTAVGREAQALVTLRRLVPDRIFASGLRRYIGFSRSR